LNWKRRIRIAKAIILIDKNWKKRGIKTSSTGSLYTRFRLIFPGDCNGLQFLDLSLRYGVISMRRNSVDSAEGKSDFSLKVTKTKNKCPIGEKTGEYHV